MKLASGIALGAASMLIASCGGGGSGTPAPTATSTPTPTPPPVSTPIPVRTSTADYLAGFTPGEDRSFQGFRISVTNEATGNTLANGSPEISSTVALEEDSGPRSSDGIGFSGSFTYQAMSGDGQYIDLANNSILFDAGASFLETQSNFLRWSLPSGPFTPEPRTLTWSVPNAFAGSQPEFYSVVMLDFPDASQERLTFMFFGGSSTLEEDLPQSGQEEQSARLTLESDEPGDGSYLLSGEGVLTIDYSAGKVTGTFDLQPGSNSLASPITVEIDADFNLTFASFSTPPGQILGDITSTSGDGRIGGGFFGTYAREIAMSVAMEIGGQSYYGDLEARRD